MSTKDMKSQLESLLFVSDEPATIEELANMLEVSEKDLSAELTSLKDEYEREERGFQLREVAGGWRLYSNPKHHELIEKYILSWDTRKLSQAALEALAVIAYRQPVTRGGVNAVRGVNSEAVMGSLLEKGLIRELGRDKAGSNAILYGTTKAFLEKFGLASVKDLPPLEEFAPQQSVKDAIRDRLDATLPADEELVAEVDDDLDDDLIETIG